MTNPLRKSVVLFVLVVSALLSAQNTPRTVSTGDEEQDLIKADSAFNDATQQRRLEGWMEFMADDVVLERGKPVVGREAARAELTPEWSNPKFKLSWKPEGAKLFEAGTLGFTWGRWNLETVAESGAPFQMKGQYLTVWKKQKDGSWKVVWDGGASSLAKK